MAPVRPVFHRLSCSNEMVRNAQNMSFGSSGVDQVRSLRKIPTQLRLANLCVNGASSAVMHWLSCSNETVRNAPKQEFWVQWSESGAFVPKRSDATSFSELVHYWHMLGQFCNDFSAVKKRSEMPQNISFGSNGVDRVRLLWKIPTQLRLANCCINSASLASFTSIFVQ
jgi:hypothetical protein